MPIYILFCICTYARSRIHNEHIIVIGIGFANGLQHLLVLETARTEARQRLAAAAYGRLLIVLDIDLHMYVVYLGRSGRLATLLLCK